MTSIDDTFDLAIFQPENNYWIAPIRHHSPACAWAVRAMIMEVQPKHVLIEAPADLSPLIDAICNPQTKPPIATVTLCNGNAAYMPFCAHSPEFVAMKAAQEIGADIQFIDRPTTRIDDTHTVEEIKIAFSNEQAFDTGNYISAMCKKTGCRDGFELWDHLFESRLGEGNWRSLLQDVGIYCAGLRHSTSHSDIVERGDDARERYMGGRIAQVLGDDKVVAVIGGFHAPALTKPAAYKTKVPKMQNSYLVRYSHPAMDALAGYSAGLPQPGFYDLLWHEAERSHGNMNWHQFGSELMHDFTKLLIDNGSMISLPAKVEALRIANSLANMRGRKPISRHDYFDGVQTAFTKGEVSSRSPMVEKLRKHWQGTAIGSVPYGTSSPPLVEEVRNRASAHRLDISDSIEKRRSLDIYRKPAHLKTSRFLHALALLDVGFGTLERGPDYVNGVGNDLMFEVWKYAWSPIVETGLIDVSMRASCDTISQACLFQIWESREKGLSQQTKLLGQGIRAGLGDKLAPFVEVFAQDVTRATDFAKMGYVIRKLYALMQTSGPMVVPDTLNIMGLLNEVYLRLVYLMDDLPNLPKERVIPAVDALRLVTELLASDESNHLDEQLFEDAIVRLSTAKASAEIIGAALSLAIRSERISENRLVSALQGNFEGVTLNPEERIGILCGLVAVSPALLWQGAKILEAVDSFLSDLTEEEFLTLLPFLRRTFASLNPNETQKLADALAQIHGADVNLTQFTKYTEQDLLVGLAVQEKVIEALSLDGLLEDANE